MAIFFQTGSLNTPAYMDKYLVLRTQGLKVRNTLLSSLPYESAGIAIVVIPASASMLTVLVKVFYVMSKELVQLSG